MIQVMVDSKVFNFINKFSDSSRTRFNLAGVRFEKNKDVVGTDGHRMGIMKNGCEIVEWDDEVHNGFTVITNWDKEVKKLLKNLSGKIEISAEYKEGRFFVGMKDEKGVSFELEGSETYPEYMRVVPERTDNTESNKIKFDPKLMMDFAGWNKDDRLSIEIHSPIEAMLVFNSSIKDFIGVLMPCRV